MDENRVISNFLIRKNKGLFIEPLEILCSESIITEINRRVNIESINNGVIIPAFFNIHSHLGESVFRHIDGEDWNITKYIEYTEKYNAKLDKEQRIASWMESARYSAEKMYLHGTLGFCAARSAGIASDYSLLTMSGYPIMNSCKLVEYKDSGVLGFQSYYNKYKSDTNKIGVFLHSIYANDLESFVLAHECMNNGAEFISVHVAEDLYTSELERKKHGMSAISLLQQYGLLSERTIIVHAGYCSDDDLLMIKKSGATISVCPISNEFLNTRMVDLYKLEEMNIPWCIATDGLGTGRTFSLLEQIKVARKIYPQISMSKYWESVTSIPARCFENGLYKGNVELGARSVFLKTEYQGTNVNELIEGLIEGEIGFKPVKM